MRVTNTRVYELGTSLIAAGLPMQSMYDDAIFKEDSEVASSIPTDQLVKTHWYKRARRLASSPIGSGHNNFLSGILVSANVEASVKWWTQFERYHFAQIVSSMSTMHRLRKMLVEDTCVFDEHVAIGIAEKLKELAKDPEIDDETVLYSCPVGVCLTARITTNYLQLKTIYNQRKDHLLTEWREFCHWITDLPLAGALIV